ncbi:MAG: diguanylate cyclase [Anaerolineales bacterium]
MNNLSELLQSTDVIPGLEVLDRLGGGRDSDVYAIRKEGQLFALKLQKSKGEQDIDARRKKEFLKEAAYLACMRHPSLPKVYESGDFHGRAYMIMELVQGPTLRKRLGQGPIRENELIPLARDIAGALAEAHAQGLIHRDVKPENIILQEKHPAKLLDFGLASSRVGHAPTGDHPVGTFRYSAPEQTGMLQRPVDARSDLYSLGVVLYEAVTGTPPFLAEDAAQLIHQHALEDPEPVRKLNPSLSSGLERIIETLMAKDPDDRYQTANGLILDLGELERINSESGSFGQVRLHSHDRVESSHKKLPIGRENEYKVLHKSWRQAREGKGQMLLLVGEPGSGKTRLTQSFVSRWLGKDVMVLSGRCGPSDPTPLNPLRTALEALLERVADLPDGIRGDMEAKLLGAGEGFQPQLARFSSSYKALLQAEGRGMEGETHIEHEDFYSAIAILLLRLSQEFDGLLFVLEDIQWLDPASKEVIERLADELNSQKIMLLMTARTSYSDPALTALDAGSSQHKRTITLSPLNEPHIEQLAHQILGGRALDRALIEDLVLLSQGNPFAATQFLRLMIEEGLLRPSTGFWLYEREAVRNLGLSHDIRDLVIRRMENLGVESFELLQKAAVIGEVFRATTLADVAAIDTQAAFQRLQEAVQAGVVESVDGAMYRFVHNQLRDFLTSGLDTEEIRRIHLDTALSMDEQSAKNSEDIYSLARHYAMADPNSYAGRVIETNYEAGVLALQDFAYQDAYEYLHRAHRIISQAGGQPDAKLSEILGETCTILGNGPQAVEFLTQALEPQSTGLDKARIRAKLGWNYVMSYELEKAWDQILRGYEEIGHPFPRSTISQATKMVFHWGRFLLATHLGIGFGGIRGVQREIMLVTDHLNQIAAHIAYFEGQTLMLLYLVAKSLDYSHRVAMPRVLARGYSNFAPVLALLGQRSRAETYIAKAVALAKEAGDQMVLAHAINYHGYTKFFSGDPLGMEVVSQHCINEYAPWLETWDYGGACANLSWSLIMRGQVREGLHWSEKARQRIRRTGIELDEPNMYLLLFRGPALMILGKPNEAKEDVYDPVDLAEDLRSDIFRRGIKASDAAFVHLEAGELGAPFEEALDFFNQMSLRPNLISPHLRHFYVIQAYGRLAQVQQIAASGNEADISVLESALGELRKAGDHPTLVCHRQVIQAAAIGLQGRKEKAYKMLVEAELFAIEYENHWAQFEAIKQRAHLLKAHGSPDAANALAWAAHAIAVRKEWPLRARRIKDAFDLTTEITSQQVASSSSDLSSGSAQLRVQRYLDALIGISSTASSMLKPEMMARDALDEMMKVFAAERAFLFLVQEDEGLKAAAARDLRGNDLEELTGFSRTVVNKVWMDETPLLLSGSEDAAVLGGESVAEKGLRSIAAAPIKLGSRLHGVVYLDNKATKGAFSQGDLEVLQAIANHIAAAIETSRAAQMEVQLELERQQRRISDVLRDVSTALNSTLDLDVVLDQLLGSLAEIMPVDRGQVLLKHEEEYRIRASRLRGSTNQTEAASSIEVDVAIIRKIERTHEPVMISDTSAEGAVGANYGEMQIRSILAVPILSRRSFKGVLLLQAFETGAYSQRAMQLATMIANQAGIAIDNAFLFGEVQRLATEDPLTGIHNRRHFMTLASLELERAQRFNHPLAAVMLDIDHFKKVNDTYGHDAGDEVLRQFAAICRSGIRAIDILGRYGGEEFCLILPQSNLADASKLAERLRHLVENSRFDAGGKALSITISLGVAERSDEDKDTVSLLSKADQALLDAKRDGRNQVTIQN